MECVLFNFVCNDKTRNEKSHIYIYYIHMFLNRFSTYMYVMQTLTKVGPAGELTMYKYLYIG